MDPYEWALRLNARSLKAARFLLRLSSLGVLTICQLLFRLFHVYTHLLCTSGCHSCALSETGWIQSYTTTLCQEISVQDMRPVILGSVYLPLHFRPLQASSRVSSMSTPSSCANVDSNYLLKMDGLVHSHPLCPGNWR